jgi:hypothetical protein
MGRAAAVLVVLAAVAIGVASASAATAPNFHLVSYGGDTWTNYDVTAPGSQSVDWPVDLVFWGNATRSKVYSQLRWIFSGSTMYAQVNDGAGAAWSARAAARTRSAPTATTACTQTPTGSCPTRS